jgi:hypothetical protein
MGIVARQTLAQPDRPVNDTLVILCVPGLVTRKAKFSDGFLQQALETCNVWAVTGIALALSYRLVNDLVLEGGLLVAREADGFRKPNLRETHEHDKGKTKGQSHELIHYLALPG